MKKFGILFSVVLLTGCTSSVGAQRALEDAGYKDVHMTGYAFFGCDEKDNFHDGFTAIGPSGRKVEGVVCSGLLKGYTIRLD